MGGSYMYNPDEDGNKDCPELKGGSYTSMYPATLQNPYVGVILSLPSVVICTSKYFPFFRLIKRYRKSK